MCGLHGTVSPSLGVPVEQRCMQSMCVLSVVVPRPLPEVRAEPHVLLSARMGNSVSLAQPIKETFLEATHLICYFIGAE